MGPKQEKFYYINNGFNKISLISVHSRAEKLINSLHKISNYLIDNHVLHSTGYKDKS